MSKKKLTVREKMLEARTLLYDIKESGYIPFTSPAPCGSERNIKNAIETAIVRIEEAIFWHDQQFTRHCQPDEQ